MSRTEIIGDATLYLGDCREILPTLSGYETVLTDPVWPNCPPDLLQGSADPFGLWFDAVALMKPAKRIVAVMRCDSDPRFLTAIPATLPFFRSMQLPYVMPGYIGRVLGGDETAYWFGEPVKFQKGRQVIPGRAPMAQPGNRVANGHPCSRALVHFQWLAEWCADDGETILDPFMGSATTGVAALQRDRKFIGIEIEQKYFDIACRRLETALKQPSFAWGAA
jgi:site-specific DNA-methyltransferase (adenine-specific)